MLAQVMVLVCGLATCEPAATAGAPSDSSCGSCAESSAMDSSRSIAVFRARAATRDRAWNEAAEWWQDALLLDGRSGADWFALGDVLLRAERHREAVAAYQRAIQADPRRSERGTRAVARAYALMGNDRQAVRWLEQAIELGARTEELWRDQSLRRYRDDVRLRSATRWQVERRGAASRREGATT